MPTPKRMRVTYAWADGLHTTLHYPHEFHVSLRGEPVITRSGNVAPPVLSGDPGPATAISAVFNRITNLDQHPKSFCNHPDCIYNMGDLITRRKRHAQSIRHLNTLIGRPHQHPAPVQSSASKPQGTTSKCLLTSSSRNPKTVPDSGASRHIEVLRQNLRNLRSCPPVLLQGINGDSFHISTLGSVGHCHGVLLAPQASASIRSVSALIDSHHCFIIFSSSGAFLVSPLPIPKAAIKIAQRKVDGLFHVIPGSVPPTVDNVESYLSVPQQLKREAVHRLHRLLGHASPRRMHTALTNHPELNTSLKPSDTKLFTHCDACEIANSNRPAKPEKANIRATAIGYRLHLDTSGTVRPATASGFTRALIAVDDASRWIFITLLRNATMDITAAAMRAILRKVAGDQSVLRTKIIRTDNGKEFCNRLVDALLAESDILRELTCVGTSH